MATLSEAQVRRWLVKRLARRLERDEGAIALDRRFDDLGLRSRDILEITGELQELVDRVIPPALVYAHPTIAELSRACTGEDARARIGKDARARAEEDECAADSGVRHEPGAVAVVGIGCRLPGGVTDPSGFWDLLSLGRSGIGEIPPDRWRSWRREEPGVIGLLGGSVPRGGFLSGDVAEFDADRFGIAPREAAAMDPQQRLTLEVADESLQHAGIAPGRLAGSPTGVFMGVSTSDYGQMLFRDLGSVDAWSGAGASPSVIANRVSYWLGVHGPSLVVDTACSSSLVAVHLAVRSLVCGESDLALAGGVNLILSPGVTINFHRAGAMAADGRCKTFDASADGYGRGEGCGVVVLKRLADALDDGDRILAVVRGGATNSDGPSNGLMAPNPGAQEAVLRAAGAEARVRPEEIDYVEAHGTGTLLGDPIEARALGRVFGGAHACGDPLLVGSVKSNIGHLEAAAGVAGLIKVVLALWHGRVPPSLNFVDPNPHIDFESLRLEVVTQERAWPERADRARPWRAGVSSFGFGGSNAHLVVERGPDAVDDGSGEEPVRPAVYCVPGGDAARVRAMAGALADHLDATDASMADVGRTLARRTSGPCGTVVAGSRPALTEGLRALADGRPGPESFLPDSVRMGDGPVWVFSGQGSQWTGMGQRLLAQEAGFADAVAELDPLFVREARYSLRTVLERGRPLDGIGRIQPVIFGVQVALAGLWRSRGVEPAGVIGHSMGEVAAAVVAGALSPADGVAVIVRRSRLLARTDGRGAMALVEIPADEAHGLAAEFPGVEVAGYMGPGQSTVAGDPRAVERFVEHLQAGEKFARLVRADVASHSSRMDPLLDELRDLLRDVKSTGDTGCRFFSTVLDDPARLPAFDADYWAANLRRPVRFEQAVREAAASTGSGCFVELSPHPLLTYAVEEILRGGGGGGGGDGGGDVAPLVLPTLRRDADEGASFRTCLARLIAAGHAPSPHALHPAGRVIDLPLIPWRRERHWLSASPRGGGLAAPVHGTLLGAADRVAADPPLTVWRALLAPGMRPYPGELTVDGVPVVPPSILLNTALEAAGDGEVTDVRPIRPVLADRRVEVQVTEQGGGLRLSTRPDASPDEAGWTQALAARVAERRPVRSCSVPSIAGERLGGQDVDALLDGSGTKGRALPWKAVEAHRGPGGLSMTVDLPTPTESDATDATAALLDAIMHVAPLAARDGDVAPRIPAGVTRVSRTGVVAGRVVIHVVSPRESSPGEGDLLLDVVACTPDGQIVLTLHGLGYATIEGGRQAGPVIREPGRLVFRPQWEPVEPPSPAAVTASVALAGGSDGFCERLARRIGESGVHVHRVRPGPDDLSDADAVIMAPPDTGEGTLTDIVGALHETLTIVRALAKSPGPRTPRLWLTTRGVRSCADDAAVLQSPLWGLAEVVAAEHPGLWGGLVDLADEDDATLATLMALTGESSPRPLAIESGTPYSLRLTPLDGAHDGPALSCRPEGAYLVTGGFGALGLETARWLAERGARRLILAGREGLPPRGDWDRLAASDTSLSERVAVIRELEKRGVGVQAVALDVGDAAAVERFVRARDVAGQPAVRGIVHATGVIGDRALLDLDEETTHAVLRSKIDGLRALETAFPPGHLDFLILYSSAGSLFGVPGQGASAAASSFLDAYARRQRGLGVPVSSLGWGPWEVRGLAIDAAPAGQQFRSAGLRPLRPEEAFLALDHVCGHAPAQALVIAPGTAPENASSAPLNGLLADVVAAATVKEPRQPGQDWSDLGPAELRTALSAAVREAAAAELRMTAGAVADTRPLADLGLDSIMGLALRRRLERLGGVSLPATTLWNHPTVRALTDLLCTLVSATGDEPDRDSVAGADSEPDGGRSWSALLNDVEDGVGARGERMADQRSIWEVDAT